MRSETHQPYETHEYGGPPEEVWERFCDTYEPPKTPDKCDSPYYYAHELVRVPIPRDTEYFVRTGDAEVAEHPELRRAMYATIEQLPGWDKEAATGYQPVVHSKQLLEHMQTEPTDRNILLAHRARRFAYALVNRNFATMSVDVSDYFIANRPAKEDWPEFVAGVRHEVSADYRTHQKIEACLGLLRASEDELAMMRTVVHITVFELLIWDRHVEDVKRQRAAFLDIINHLQTDDSDPNEGWN